MESYNKSILEYSDIAEAVEYAAERAERRGEKRGEKRGEERAERRKNIQFVRKCLQKGMSIIEIADFTDLPIETVKELLKEIQG